MHLGIITVAGMDTCIALHGALKNSLKNHRILLWYFRERLKFYKYSILYIICMNKNILLKP